MSKIHSRVIFASILSLFIIISSLFIISSAHLEKEPIAAEALGFSPSQAKTLIGSDEKGVRFNEEMREIFGK